MMKAQLAKSSTEMRAMIDDSMEDGYEYIEQEYDADEQDKTIRAHGLTEYEIRGEIISIARSIKFTVKCYTQKLA